MKHFKIENVALHQKTGINKEWALSLHFLGYCPTKHDKTPWNVGSDIEPLKISVKSDRFSLTAGGQLRGQSKAEMLDDYFNRVASKVFAYVTKSYEVYEMNPAEFKEFLEQFGYISRESSSNGGKTKIKAKDESRAMLAWLAERA